MDISTLQKLINCNNLEVSGGNTPDFILAEFLKDLESVVPMSLDTNHTQIKQVITIFGKAVRERDKWFVCAPSMTYGGVAKDGYIKP